MQDIWSFDFDEMIISCLYGVITLSHLQKVTINTQIILIFFINSLVFLGLDYSSLRYIVPSIGMIVYNLLK